MKQRRTERFGIEKIDLYGDERLLKINEFKAGDFGSGCIGIVKVTSDLQFEDLVDYFTVVLVGLTLESSILKN